MHEDLLTGKCLGKFVAEHDYIDLPFPFKDGHPFCAPGLADLPTPDFRAMKSDNLRHDIQKLVKDSNNMFTRNNPEASISNRKNMTISHLRTEIESELEKQECDKSSNTDLMLKSDGISQKRKFFSDDSSAGNQIKISKTVEEIDHDSHLDYFSDDFSPPMLSEFTQNTNQCMTNDNSFGVEKSFSLGIELESEEQISENICPICQCKFSKNTPEEVINEHVSCCISPIEILDSDDELL